MKKIATLLAGIVLMGASVTSCGDFLEEESYGTDVSAFLTEQGSEALVSTLYYKLKYYGYGCFNFGEMTELGTDIWLRGGNSGESELADYRGLTATNGTCADMWNHYYKELWNIHYFLEQYENVEFKDQEKKARLKGEALMFKAYTLFALNNIYGDVYLPVSTNAEEGVTARRSSREVWYQTIYKCMDEAMTLLPETTPELGRLTRPIAKAFLCRVYLYDKQWDKVKELSTDLIENYNYNLAPSWDALWDEFNPSEENIWTCVWGKEAATSIQGGNMWWQAFNMWIDRYPGVQTMIGYTGFGGCHLAPSKFYLSLYNKEGDDRWASGFQRAWIYNDGADDTSKFPKMQTQYRDTALYLYPGILTQQQREYMAPRYTAFDMNDLYKEDGSPIDRRSFFCMKKFNDDDRKAALDADYSGLDYPIIRLGEVYLMRAEANMHLSQPDRAADDINTLRKRIILPGHEAEMTVKANDISEDFLLDERARELSGEFMRWFDLKRTGKLVERVKKYNPDAAPYIKEYHVNRPIPQIQFDGMPDPSTLGQNEGY